MNASDTSRIHDSSRQDLCPCKRCDLERIVAIAGSRANNAESSSWRAILDCAARRFDRGRHAAACAADIAQAKYLRESQQ